jgi:hypothetical protein
MALWNVLSDFTRRTKCVRSAFTLPVAQNSFTVAMTAGTSPVPSDWRRERTISIQVSYNNRGTWLIGSTYAPMDLVTNNGTPDGFTYVCTAANTGQQPPNDQYWVQVSYDMFCPVALVTEVEVANYQERMNVPIPNVWNQWTPPGWLVSRGGFAWAVNLGVPVLGAYRDDGTFMFWPQASAAYNLYFKYWGGLVPWTWGTTGSDAVVFAIPDEYIYRAIVTGCASQLQMNTPAGRMTGVEWQEYEKLVKEVCGTVNIDTWVMSRRRPGISI